MTKTILTQETRKVFKTRNYWFRGLVGYGICLTRRTSPVRSWAKSYFLFATFLVVEGPCIINFRFSVQALLGI